MSDAAYGQAHLLVSQVGVDEHGDVSAIYQIVLVLDSGATVFCGHQKANGLGLDADSSLATELLAAAKELRNATQAYLSDLLLHTATSSLPDPDAPEEERRPAQEL